jgi:hypothetical protein
MPSRYLFHAVGKAGNFIIEDGFIGLSVLTSSLPTAAASKASDELMSRSSGREHGAAVCTITVEIYLVATES